LTAPQNDLFISRHGEGCVKIPEVFQRATSMAMGMNETRLFFDMNKSRQVVQNCSFRDKLVRNSPCQELAWSSSTNPKPLNRHKPTSEFRVYHRVLLSRQGQRQTKPVIRILERRRQRASGSAAAEFNPVTPRAAPGSAPLSEGRALGIAFRRVAIITGIVVIAAPFMNAFAHVVKPKVVGRVGAHLLRPAGLSIATGIGSLPGRLISPRIAGALKFPSRRSLTLGLSGKTELSAGSLG